MSPTASRRLQGLSVSVSVFVLTALGLLSCAHAGRGGLPRTRSEGRGEALRVAAVQLAVGPEMLSSHEAYARRIEDLVERSMTFDPHLIVFPEYTSAFIALIPHHRIIEESTTMDEAMVRIAAADSSDTGSPDAPAPASALVPDIPGTSPLGSLFLRAAGDVESQMSEIFGALARRHDVAILAGTTFARDGADGTELRNRAVVFGPDGHVVYEQDKVYLTDFERNELGLAPGSLGSATPFEVAGRRVAVSICRDTFFEEWEPRLSGSDLWIDVKANGVEYTQQERERFLTALPERIRRSDVPYGLTVCLTGALLDLVWEGESSLVTDRTEEDDGVEFVRRARTPAHEEILYLTIEP